MAGAKQLAMLNAGVEILDKGIVAIKKIEAINELDRAGAIVLNKLGGRSAYALRTPLEKTFDTANQAQVIAGAVKEIVPNASSEVDLILCELFRATAEEVGGLYRWTKKNIQAVFLKNRGSKVKADRFEGCRIVYAGDQSYIEFLAGEENVRLHLTPECVQSCSYDRKKYKPMLGHHHYYLNINYTDGTRSYIRVSKKHLKNFIPCGLVLPSDVEL